MDLTKIIPVFLFQFTISTAKQTMPKRGEIHCMVFHANHQAYLLFLPPFFQPILLKWQVYT